MFFRNVESPQSSPIDSKNQRKKKSFQCNHEDCGRTFSRNLALKDHMVTHLSGEAREKARVACKHPGCDKTCASQKVLSVHMRTHTEEKTYVCSCGKGFTNNCNFKKHIKKMDDSSEHRPVKQPEKRHLSNRARVQAEPNTVIEKKVNADVPLFEFSVDAFEKSYNPNTFFSDDILSPISVRPASTKLAPRNPEKPFACDHEGCDASFAKNFILTRHKKIHLPKEAQESRKHVCTYEGCNKSISTRSNLKKHMLTHTGEKPYVCSCGEKYTANATLKKHIIKMGDPLEHRSLTQPKKKRLSNRARVPAEPNTVIEKKVNADVPLFEFSADAFEKSYNPNTFFSDDISSLISDANIELLCQSSLVTEEKKPTPFQEPTQTAVQPASTKPLVVVQSTASPISAQSSVVPINISIMLNLTPQEFNTPEVRRLLHSGECQVVYMNGQPPQLPEVLQPALDRPLVTPDTVVVQDEKKNEAPISMPAKEQKDITFNITSTLFKNKRKLDEVITIDDEKSSNVVFKYPR